MARGDLGKLVSTLASSSLTAAKFTLNRVSHIPDQGLFAFLPEKYWFVSPIEKLTDGEKEQMYFTVGLRGDISYQVKAACTELGVPFTSTKKQKKLLKDMDESRQREVMIQAGKYHPTRDLEREAFEILANNKITEDQAKKKNPRGTLGILWMGKNRRANHLLHQLYGTILIGGMIIIPYALSSQNASYQRQFTEAKKNLKQDAVVPTKSTFIASHEIKPSSYIDWIRDPSDNLFQSVYKESDIEVIIQEKNGKRYFPEIHKHSITPYEAETLELHYGIDIKWRDEGGKKVSFVSYSNPGKPNSTDFKIENRNGNIYFPEVEKGSITPVEAKQKMMANPEFKIYFEKNNQGKYVSMASATRGEHVRNVVKSNTGEVITKEITGKKL